MENENMDTMNESSSMDNQTQNPEPKTTNPMSAESTQPAKKSNGALFGILILIVVLVVVGIVLSNKKDSAMNQETPEGTAITEDVAAEQPAMTDSTMVTDIEADLEATNFEEFEADLQALDSEI